MNFIANLIMKIEKDRRDQLILSNFIEKFSSKSININIYS